MRGGFPSLMCSLALIGMMMVMIMPKLGDCGEVKTNKYKKRTFDTGKWLLNQPVRKVSSENEHLKIPELYI